MKKFIFIFIILSVIFDIYSRTYKTYHNVSSNFEYSIDYPADFEVIKTKSALKLIFSYKDKNVKFKDNILILVTDISYINKNFEEFEDLWKKMISWQLEDFQLLDKTRTIIDGKRSISYVYTGRDKGINLKYMRYSIDNTPNVYEIIYEAREDTFDFNLETFDTIIETLKIKK